MERGKGFQAEAAELKSQSWFKLGFPFFARQKRRGIARDSETVAVRGAAGEAPARYERGAMILTSNNVVTTLTPIWRIASAMLIYCQ